MGTDNGGTPAFGLPRPDYDAIEAAGPMPALHPDTIRVEARRDLEDIRDFITTDEFLDLLDDVYSLPADQRDEFVRTVILDPDELRKRGVVPPPGIKLQRSQFGDGRPTIFCVVKVLSDGIRKVTFTFDSQSALARR